MVKRWGEYEGVTKLDCNGKLKTVLKFEDSVGKKYRNRRREGSGRDLERCI
jgi:hypothetical protein